MTICVPIRPFEVAGQIMWGVVCWSWIPLFGMAIYGLQVWDLGLTVVGGVLGMVPCMLCFILWLPAMNEQYHWISWCKKNEVEI